MTYQDPNDPNFRYAGFTPPPSMYPPMPPQKPKMSRKAKGWLIGGSIATVLLLGGGIISAVASDDTATVSSPDRLLPSKGSYDSGTPKGRTQVDPEIPLRATLSDGQETAARIKSEYGTVITPEIAAGFADIVCWGFSKDFTFAEIGSVAQEAFTRLSSREIGFLIGASIRTTCPEYAYKIR